MDSKWYFTWQVVIRHALRPKPFHLFNSSSAHLPQEWTEHIYRWRMYKIFGTVGVSRANVLYHQTLLQKDSKYPFPLEYNAVESTFKAKLSNDSNFLHVGHDHITDWNEDLPMTRKIMHGTRAYLSTPSLSAAKSVAHSQAQDEFPGAISGALERQILRNYFSLLVFSSHASCCCVVQRPIELRCDARSSNSWNS